MTDENPPEPPYKVGYGRPPEHARFEPGRSGNPKGRPKGVNNLKTDVRRALAAPIKVRSDGRARNVSTQEASILKLREKALKGDQRSLEQVLALAARFNNEP